MSLKILHTGDLHIGMKFRNYPDYLKDKLIEARFQVLDRLIRIANNEQCNLFVIAGDLFDKLNIPRRDINRVISILKGFAGDCVLVLPGNHDYDSGGIDLWDYFAKNISGNIVLLNEYRPYSLKEFDLDAVIYPAYCQSKHSSTNNLGWIKNLEEKGDARWKLGIAHGALAGISPDMDGNYFMMGESELEETGLDLWLLGHTHIPYPQSEQVNNRIIFNNGTPEPDGLDCNHSGSAWIITITEDKEVQAQRIRTGAYRFFDLKYTIETEADFEKMKGDLLEGDPAGKIVRVRLSGRIDEDLYNSKEDIYREIRDRLAYLSVDDDNLKIRINQEVIDREFSDGSLPHRFLKELACTDEEDDALQLAYELVKEVRQ